MKYYVVTKWFFMSKPCLGVKTIDGISYCLKMALVNASFTFTQRLTQNLDK